MQRASPDDPALSLLTPIGKLFPQSNHRPCLEPVFAVLWCFILFTLAYSGYVGTRPRRCHHPLRATQDEVDMAEGVRRLSVRFCG